jgi:hypothetical protein
MIPSRPSDDSFEWRYSIEIAHYANTAGDLTLVRPRVLGEKALALLETKDPREHPIEFESAERDSDVIEITLPSGLSLESLPAPVDIDDGFAAFRSKSELLGRTLRYTRVLEIEQPSVPVDRAKELRTFYRAVATDERNEAAFRHSP